MTMRQTKVQTKVETRFQARFQIQRHSHSHSLFKMLMRALALCLLPLAGLPAHAGEPLPAGLSNCQASFPLARDGADQKLARGFNLPNWDPAYSGYKPDDSLLGQLNALGFTHIRLPVPAERFMETFSTPEQISAYSAALDAEVTRLVGLDYAVSIDLHPSSPFQHLHMQQPEKGLALLLDAWDRIAALSVQWPRELVYFELLNEPAPSQSVWWPQAQKLVTHLNATEPGRKLVVGPAVFQRSEILAASEPLVGEGLVYAIHYYDPMVFTHQAMTWMPQSPLALISHVPFPADASSPLLIKQVEKLKAAGMSDAAERMLESYRDGWNAERIAAALAEVGKWSRDHKLPVIINEFGTLTFAVDPHARAEWLRAVRTAAEQNCLGWTHWDFSDGFMMVNPETTLPDPLVLDALLPQS